MNLPSNNGDRTAQGRFTLGNKFGKGRPHGSRKTVTLLIDEMLANEAEAITSKLVNMALNGDITALRLCIDRICPVRKGRTVTLDIPPIESISDALQAVRTIVTAATNGEISPTEAMDLAAVLEFYRKASETNDIVFRLATIEKQLKEAGI